MDGIAVAGEFPSRLPARRRAFQLLPSCTPSRWDETGKPREGTARSIVYKYAKKPASGSASFDYLSERALDRGKWRVDGGPAWVKDDIPLRSDLGATVPEDLAEPAFDAIAHHRSADRTRNGESEARSALRTRSRQAEGREHGIGEANAFVINHSEFGWTQDSACSRKSKRTGRGGASSPSRTGQLSRRSP